VSTSPALLFTVNTELWVQRGQSICENSRVFKVRSAMAPRTDKEVGLLSTSFSFSSIISMGGASEAEEMIELHLQELDGIRMTNISWIDKGNGKKELVGGVSIQDQVPDVYFPFDEGRDDTGAVIIESQSILEMNSIIITESADSINKQSATPDESCSSGACDRDPSSFECVSVTVDDNGHEPEGIFSAMNKELLAIQGAAIGAWDSAYVNGTKCASELFTLAQKSVVSCLASLIGEEKECIHCRRMVHTDYAILRVYAYDNDELHTDFLHRRCHRQRKKVEHRMASVLDEICSMRDSTNKPVLEWKGTPGRQIVANESKHEDLRRFYA
jgi:hypothetical protein